MSGIDSAGRSALMAAALLLSGPGIYDLRGWQPAFTAAIPQMTVEMIVAMPFAEDYRKLAPNPDGFPVRGALSHGCRGCHSAQSTSGVGS